MIQQASDIARDFSHKRKRDCLFSPINLSVNKSNRCTTTVEQNGGTMVIDKLNMPVMFFSLSLHRMGNVISYLSSILGSKSTEEPEGTLKETQVVNPPVTDQNPVHVDEIAVGLKVIIAAHLASRVSKVLRRLTLLFEDKQFPFFHFLFLDNHIRLFILSVSSVIICQKVFRF